MTFAIFTIIRVKFHYSHFLREIFLLPPSPSFFPSLPSFAEIPPVGGHAHKRNGQHEEVMVGMNLHPTKGSRILWPQQDYVQLEILLILTTGGYVTSNMVEICKKRYDTKLKVNVIRLEQTNMQGMCGFHCGMQA